MEEYRLLQVQEYQQFSDTFFKAFHRYPDMKQMTAMCAWENGEIVGFMGMYTPIVLDSMWVKPEKRAKNMCVKLIKAIGKLPWQVGHGCYFFAAKPSHEAIARKFGARKSQMSLWKWVK